VIRIGVICPSEIAFRRFIPSLNIATEFEYIGVAVASAEEWFGVGASEISQEIKDDVLNKEYEKAGKFIETYGGKVFDGYHSLIISAEVDAIYLPLPPALHFRWAKLALENGKNVFIEKPSTTDLENTKELVALANKKGLALHENYMFAFHNQLSMINDIVNSGEIGDVRLYKISFGFPRRNSNDFRYNKALGGGALLDCGGYTIKYASMLLGESAKIAYANLNYIDEFDVDMYGSAAMLNDAGRTVQLSFGMDNNYKCELEVWGSKGCLNTNRILTAPAGMVPECTIITDNEIEVRKLPSDDAFLKSIQRFQRCVKDETVRKENYHIILGQATLIDEFMKCSVRNT
jgi:dTDP-3,4-didehydro-2,6-dideoxy-alpha-D-glucose 3-reductase